MNADEKREALIAAARTWKLSECSASPVGASAIIQRLADALEVSEVHRA